MLTPDQTKELRRADSQTSFLTTKSIQLERDLDTFLDDQDALKRSFYERLDKLKRRMAETEDAVADAKTHVKAVIRELQKLASTGDMRILNAKLERWRLSEYITVSQFSKYLEEYL